MSETPVHPSEIRGLVIPLQGGHSLLLPNAAVAEIIDYHGVEPEPGLPDWVVGQTGWRQRRLMVVQLERLLGEPVSGDRPRQRIVVCHVLDPAARRPFVGIVAAAIPRLARIREDALEGRPLPDEWRALPLRAALAFDGEPMLVPDLPGLESRIEAHEGETAAT